MIISELYWIATNESFEMSVRYSAARQMQQMRQPQRMALKQDLPRKPQQIIIPPDIRAILQWTRRRRAKKGVAST